MDNNCKQKVSRQYVYGCVFSDCPFGQLGKDNEGTNKASLQYGYKCVGLDEYS